MEDFKYAYFHKCAELKLPPNLAIIDFLRKENTEESSLNTLNLEKMNLNDQDIQPVLLALEKNNTLKNLILPRNQIKDLSIFEELFKRNSILEGLDISGNPFSDGASKSLIDLLSLKTNVKWFNITKKSPEKKQSIKTHKKSESICPPKSLLAFPLQLSSTLRKIPAPHKPKDTGGHATFRSSLYQGPNSARTWKNKEDLEEGKLETEPTCRGNQKEIDMEKENKVPKNDEESNKKAFGMAGIQIEDISKRGMMERTEWILKMKGIFSSLVSEFEETLFHKALLIKRIRNESKKFPFMSEETYGKLYFDKGLSLEQILGAIDSSEESYLRYDDIIEIIWSLGKQKMQIPLSSIDSTRDSNIYFKSNNADPSLLEGNSLPQNNVSNPHIPIMGSDYVECSFSIENQGFGDLKDNQSRIHHLRKPPKFIPRNNNVNNIPFQKRVRSKPEQSVSSPNYVIRHQPLGSPTEIETARFNREPYYESAIKDKNESYKLEISAEISQLQDLGMPENESILHDIENGMNTINTTAKLMSAFGETPHNLSNLNTYNLLDKLPLDNQMESFTIIEYASHSPTVNSSIKQILGSKIFKPQELNFCNENQIYGSSKEQIDKNLKVPLLRISEKGYLMKRIVKQNSIFEKELGKGKEPHMNNENKLNEEDGWNKEDFSQIQERSSKEIRPEKRLNHITDFLNLFEKTKNSLENYLETGNNKETLLFIDGFKANLNDLHPLISFSWMNNNEIKKIPYSNSFFYELIQQIEALKLVKIPDINISLPLITIKNLRIMNLSNNGLTNINFLENFKNLEFINLSCNKLKSLPGFGNCVKLREIYLEYNKFSQLPNFFGLDQITLISASFNLISSFENIANLTLNKKLYVLDLSGNPVTNKPSYKTLIKNLLPQVQKIDVAVIEFSEFRVHENICFTKISETRKQAQGQVFNQNIQDSYKENLKPVQINKEMSLIFSESDLSEEDSANKKKVLKSLVPKLNIENIQPLDFSFLRNGNLAQRKPSKIDIHFGNVINTAEEARIITARSEKVHHSPTKNNTLGTQFRRKSSLLSNRFNINFLSQRDHISFKLRRNGTSRDAKKESYRYADLAPNNLMATFIKPKFENEDQEIQSYE